MLNLSLIGRSCQNAPHDKQNTHSSWLKPQGCCLRLECYDKDSTNLRRFPNAPRDTAGLRKAAENSFSYDKTASWNVRDNHTSNHGRPTILTKSATVAVIQRLVLTLHNEIFPWALTIETGLDHFSTVTIHLYLLQNFLLIRTLVTCNIRAQPFPSTLIGSTDDSDDDYLALVTSGERFADVPSGYTPALSIS